MAYIIERLIIALLAFLASIAGAVKERGLPEPTTAGVEITTAWVPPITETAPPATVPTTESVFSDYSRGFVHYRVGECVPPYEWEWYLYGKLSDRGLEWFYPYAVCQIYQESNWNQYSTNGRDHGLCQQKGIYWADRAAAAGIPGADIWDVYAQLTVYVWMMGNNLAAAGGNVGQALSIYYLGYAGWSDEYVGHVTKWLDYLEEVE